MILDIKPVHELDCFGDIIASVALWWGRGYKLGYIGSWGFSYEECKSNSRDFVLGKRIGPGSEDLLLNLERYHGIKIIRHETKTIEEIFPIAIKELERNRPLGIYLDSFWNPWDQFYQKAHNAHVCLIVGYDEKSMNFNCIDPYFQKEGLYLPFEHFRCGCGPCFTFSIVNDKEHTHNWKEIIEGQVKRSQGESNSYNTYYAMKHFADDLSLLTDLKNETRGYDSYEKSPLLLNINRIYFNRMTFSHSLQYLASANKIEALLDASKMMGQYQAKWSVIYYGLIKACYLQNSAELLKRISTYIYEVADKEKEFIDILSKIVNDNTNSLFSYYDSSKVIINGKQKLDDIVFIDIRKLFNNNAFADSLSDDCTADLNVAGTYFISDKSTMEEIWTIDEMKFQFPILCNGKNDNLVCKGQMINIPKGCYDTIMLLGCADWGDHMDKIVIKYDSGIEEEIPLKFSGYTKPIFGECIAWTGHCAYRAENSVAMYPVPVHLYAQKIILKHRGIMTGLCLPYCSNIHIFSISFCKVGN